MVRLLMASSLGVMSQKALLPTPMDAISAMRISGWRVGRVGSLFLDTSFPIRLLYLVDLFYIPTPSLCFSTPRVGVTAPFLPQNQG